MGAKLGQNNVRGEQTRRAIISSAAECFAESGYRNASLVSIAERAGVTQSGLLHHFRTKEDLVSAVLAERASTDETRLLDLLAENTDAVQGMRALLADALTHRIDSRFLAVMTAEATTVDHPVQETMSERYAQLRNRLVGALASSARGSAPDAADLEATATALIALVEGIQLQWIYDPNLDILAAFDRVQWLATTRDRAELAV